MKADDYYEVVCLTRTKDLAEEQIRNYNLVEYYMSHLFNDIPELKPYYTKIKDCADVYVEIKKILKNKEKEIRKGLE